MYAFGRFRCPFLGSFLVQMSCIFRTLFKHTFRACVLHVSSIFRTAGPSKKHCISAVKHVFQQGPHIQHSVGKSKDFTLFQGTIFDDFASIFDRFPVSFFSLIFEAVLAALQAENGSKAGPKTTQNRSKNAFEKSSKKRR